MIIGIVFLSQVAQTFVVSMNESQALPLQIISGLSIFFPTYAGETVPTFSNAAMIAILAILAFWLFNTKSRIRITPIALSLGGVTANAIEAFQHGAILRYLDLQNGSNHLPPFNFADLFIIIGVTFFILSTAMPIKHHKCCAGH